MAKKNKNIEKKQKNDSNSTYIKVGDNKISLRVLLGIIILLVSFVLYIRTIGFDLVQCDDDVMVLQEFSYNSQLSNLTKAFDRTFFVDDVFYRPVLTISFIIDANIGGANIEIYRLTNILIHTISSLLLFVFLLKLKFSEIHSFVASLFFAVHPILTPAVSWISGRNDSLLTLFTLISFIYLINYLENKNFKKWIYLGVHIFAFFLSMYTKESAIIIPFMIVLYLYFIRNDKNFKNYIFPAVGWTIIIAVWYFMRESVIKKAIGEGQLQTSPMEALMENIPTLLALLGKVILPIRMSPLSNYEILTYITGIIFIALLVIAFILIKKLNKKLVVFGFLWYLLFISPTLLARIRDFDFDYAEHRIYLPLIGIILILVEVFRSLNLNFKNKKIIAIASIILVLLSVDSFAYQTKFKNPPKFWGHFIKTYPKTTRGFIGLGKYYFTLDSIAKVEALMLKGMKVKPDFKYWYTNLSTIEMKRKNLEKSGEWAYKSLQFDPNDDMANFNYAVSLAASNRVAEAIPYFEKAALIGKRPLWFAYLGDAYSQADRPNQAISAYQKALSMDPTLEKAYSSLAFLYIKLNQPNQAISIYQQVLALNPNNPNIYVNFGGLYAELKMYQEAEAMWQKALSINPDAIQAYSNLLHLSLMQNNTVKIKLYANELRKRGVQLPPEALNILNQ